MGQPGAQTDQSPAQAGARPAAQAGAMWGGRFASAPDALFRALNDSLPVDWRLVQHDIVGSVAWARALGRAGVLTPNETDTIVIALGQLADEAATLNAPPTDSGAEDVHTWVEQQLVVKIGAVGKKLHTGRSRNDQVATDLRLWLKDAGPALAAGVRGVQRALADKAVKHAGTAFPSYTHLQRAQPITFGHWCLAYTEMLERDVSRLQDALDRADECPLGSAALAGTAFPVDRAELAHDLGFARPSANSLDAVSDRDVVAELLATLALMGVHLSRFAEDLICYGSSEFALVECDDGVTSGSSLMPQKKNPDALEIIRGRAGSFIGAHAGFIATLKGLPLAYNKDLQDDKQTLFDAIDHAVLVLRLSARVVEGLRVDAERARAAASGGHANATDLADEMVRRGVPFREAHERVGRLVRAALATDVPLEGLSAEVVRGIWPELAPEAWGEVQQSLLVDACLAARSALGGTAPERVAERAEHWRAKLAIDDRDVSAAVGGASLGTGSAS